LFLLVRRSLNGGELLVRGPAADRVRLDAELATVDEELAKLIAFIKRGIASETLQHALAATEAKRTALRAAVERLVQAEAFRTATAQLEQQLTAILTDWQDIRTKPLPQQRQLVRKLLPGRITVEPHVRGSRRWVDFRGDLTLAPIISGIAPAVGDEMPDGMGRRWWPQRDSNPCFSLERAVGSAIVARV
jgi:hypothetical protein